MNSSEKEKTLKLILELKQVTQTQEVKLQIQKLQQLLDENIQEK